MQSRKEKNGWLLVLVKGEEIRATIGAWAKKEGIAGAYFWGIGAVTDAELGFFDTAKNKYENKLFSGEYELLSCIGDITEDGVHAHISMSGADFISVGGHLQRATISVFGEFFVLPTDFIGRSPDIPTGLRKIDLGRKK